MGSTYFSKRIWAIAKHKIGGRNRLTRPKTFSSEEAAKKWAAEQGLENYSLVNLKTAEAKTKKIRIEAK